MSDSKRTRMNIFAMVLICVLIFLFFVCVMYIIIRDTDRQRRVLTVREAHDYLQEHNIDASKLSNIPIYIHTISRLSKRQANMRKQMDKIKYTNYRFYYGLDKNEMDLNTWTLPDGVHREIRVPPGERPVLVAHTLSMLGLLQTFYSTGEPHMLLLEDDVSLCLLPGWDKSIREIMDEAPSDWSILSLIPHHDKGVTSSILTRIGLVSDDYSNKSIRYRKYDSFSCAAWIFTREAAKTILDTVVSETEIDLYKFGRDIVADMSFPRIVKTYALNKFYFIDYNLDDDPSTMINADHTWMKLAGWEDDLFSVYNSVYLEERKLIYHD